MNAANEVAVEAFLNHELAFHEIAQVIESVLDAHACSEITDLDAVLKADRWAREEAKGISRKTNHIAIRS